MPPSSSCNASRARHLYHSVIALVALLYFALATTHGPTCWVRSWCHVLLFPVAPTCSQPGQPELLIECPELRNQHRSQEPGWQKSQADLSRMPGIATHAGVCPFTFCGLAPVVRHHGELCMQCGMTISVFRRRAETMLNISIVCGALPQSLSIRARFLLYLLQQDHRISDGAHLSKHAQVFDSCAWCMSVLPWDGLRANQIELLTQTH